MGIFSGRMFWGTVVILCGLSVAVDAVFGIDIPFFSLALAFFFIFMGAKLLFEDKAMARERRKYRRAYRHCQGNENEGQEEKEDK